MITLQLIDNDPLSIFIIWQIAAQHPSAVHCVVIASGDEAVSGMRELATQQQPLPDLLLLDIHLPGMHEGWAVLDVLKEVDLPVVILTSFVSPRDRERARQYPNVWGLFQKPLTRDMFRDILALLEPRQATCTP